MEPPATQAEGGGGGGVRRQQQQQPGMGQMLTGVIRIAVFWYFASKFFGPKRSPTQSSQQISNLFHKGELLVRIFAPLVLFIYADCSFFFRCAHFTTSVLMRGVLVRSDV